MHNPSEYMVSDEALAIVRQESARAIQKHGYNNTCLNPELSRDAKQHILVEEVGEVSKAFNEYNLGNISYEEFIAQLKKELPQVAAVATMWLEAENGE
jgi:hypothetical protein